MDQHIRAFVGIDTSKLRNAVAVAEEGRGGDVRYLGEIDTTEAATRKLVTKLAAKYRQLTFCHEARLPRGGTLAHPEETWRSGEDEPTRCGRPSQAIACRGTHRVLGARRAARGDARSLAVRQESERVERLEQAIRDAVPEWSPAGSSQPCRRCAG